MKNNNAMCYIVPHVHINHPFVLYLENKRNTPITADLSFWIINVSVVIHAVRLAFDLELGHYSAAAFNFAAALKDSSY